VISVLGIDPSLVSGNTEVTNVARSLATPSTAA
jgi:hypothetical protein